MMMLEKMATQGLLKMTVFWNKGYEVIIPARKTLFLRGRFGSSSIIWDWH